MSNVNEQADGNPRRKSGGNGEIPRRPHHSSVRRSSIPAQPSLRQHTMRLIIATTAGLAIMLVLLMIAKKYLERDWQQKQRQAWAARIHPPAPQPANNNGEPQPVLPDEGREFSLPPEATGRLLDRMSSDAMIANWWAVIGRTRYPDKQLPIQLAALRMAMATGVDAARVKNDAGVVWMQHQKMRQAATDFRAALRIRPGLPPALFNLALCEVSERHPALATRWLAYYLARRPDDTAAYRLQSTLLTQLDRPADALRMLEVFLRNKSSDHPLFLEAAILAARLGQHGNAIRYLETAMNGNPIPTVIRAYQSPPFREVRLSDDGPPLAARLAKRARNTYAAPIPAEEIQPLRADPRMR